MPLVVHTARSDADHGPQRQIFKENGMQFVVPPPTLDPFRAADLVEMLRDASAVVAGSEPYTAEIIRQLPKLRVIARWGVGFDAIDLRACDAAQIAVCTTPGVNHHAVAEHAIALLLAVVRGFPRLEQDVRHQNWRMIPRPRAMGKTLGLVGLGRIGQAVATRAIGLGMNVIACEPFPDIPFIQEWNIELVDLNTLLNRSEFVSLHCPSSSETAQLMNAQRFARMKRGAILINTARGSLVDEEALCDSLRSGHLGGAGLDVFQKEPLALKSPLLEFDNVLVSPHIGGTDWESWYDTSRMVASIIVGLHQGRWPEGCVQNLKGEADWRW